MAKIYSFSACRQKYPVKSVMETIAQEYADGTRKLFMTDKERHAQYVRNNPDLHPDGPRQSIDFDEEFAEIPSDPDHWTNQDWIDEV